MQFKSFMEALKGKQHKIDKNKNGQIDAHDFKLLRKEETEQLEEGLDPSEVAGNPRMYSADTVKKAFYHKNASESDKQSLAKHLDRHHGNKEWRKPVKEESEERMARADYKTSPSGRKSHKEIVFNSGEEKENEKEEMKEEMTDAQMKKREEIVKSMKKDKAGFKDRYGDRAETVMYATATKMAMKEEVEHVDYILEYESDLAKMKKSDSYKVGDKVWTKVGGQWHRGNITTPLNKAGNHGVKFHHKGMTHSTVSNPHSELRLNVEELDEKSDQAKRNKTMKNMMDASRGARFKLNNPVPDAEPEHKTARAHNVAIGRALRNEEDKKKEDPPFDGPYTKTPGTTKDKSGAVHTPMSRAKHLAKMAMKKQMKEDIDRLFEKDDSEYNYEGEMAVTQLKTITRHAEALQAKMQPDTNLPEWVQSKITLATDYMQTAHDYLMSEIDEQAPVAPVPGMKFKNHAVMVHPETKSRVVINRKNIDNYTSDGYKEVSPGQKLKEDEEVKFSYTELMMINEIKLADLPVRRIKGHSYGADYSDPEGADDYDDKKPMKPTAEKRGRGRPAGSQSGARKNFGSSKLHTK